MAKKKQGMRRTAAGICLAALSAFSGASLFAEKASSIKAPLIEEPTGKDVERDESGSASLGGALYSPFSPAFEAVPQPLDASAAPTRQDVDEGTPDLVVTTVASSVAAGLLVVLVRVLVAS
ncbi:hypothetical protein AB4Z46_01810 [Variovorax sp. M-6]|uniref:hypothetical protein n=1 Tax=Variovorax sp. M-6 TaxID=3233041 RepID=UPI003F9DBD42